MHKGALYAACISNRILHLAPNQSSYDMATGVVFLPSEERGTLGVDS